MKKSFYLMAALLVAMVGCNKEPQENAGLSSEDKVFMSFSIKTVTTRSETDDNAEEGGNPSNSDAAPDYEVGHDYENTITSVDVVLRNDNKFVVAEKVNPTPNAGAWVATFSSAQLSEGEKFSVYIYANSSASQNLDAVSTAAISEMTDSNFFWMTNAYQAKQVIVGELSTSIDAPTDLGDHYVERSMARFDYMAIEEDNTYDIADDVTITLTEAALINQSKEFYLLRRAYESGNTGTITIGYPELPTNYVVDTDWSDKTSAYVNDNYVNVADNFEYHLSAPDTWIWKSLNLTEDDNWTGTNAGATGINPAPNHSLDGYKIFCYAKENTIPNPDTQVNGLSTGIVFKGKLAGGVVTNANGETIYVFDNVLYGTWADVVKAAQTSTSEAFKFAVSVCNNDGTAKDAETLAAAGFTGYSADANGDYYTYYYYWNRHNDNADNTSMGDMEFAVVRNNVYKLCVDNISKYGHPTPGSSDPDPDPVDPTDPDEQGEYYFKVTVKVLPWVVRVNHIEF